MRINRWKLALIVGVFVIFAIYLLPTPKSLYGMFYGYLDVWIQQRIPRPEVVEGSANALSFDLSEVVFPEGMDFQEATSRLETILRGRLEPLGFEEVSKEALSSNPLVGNQFSFDTTEVMFSVGAFNDLTSLAAILRDAQEPLAQYLRKQFSPDTQQLLDEHNVSSPPSEALQKALIKELDQLLQGGWLYDEGRFAQVMLTEKTRKLLAERPRGDALISLNRLLLEEAYPNEIAKSQQFLVKFALSKDDIEAIAKKLNLYGAIHPSLRNLLPDKRINLGLDLRGGVHLVLELDMEETKESLIKERKTSIYGRLRSENVYLKPEDIVRKQGRDILLVDVTVPPEQRLGTKREVYLKKAREVLSELEFFDEPDVVDSSTPEKVKYSLELNEAGLEKYSERAIDQVLEVLRNRIDAFGVAEPSIRQEPGKPRIIIQLPGAKDSSQALGVVKTMGRLEFKLVKEKEKEDRPWMGSENTPLPVSIPGDCEIRRGTKGEWLVLEKQTLLTGDHIKDAGVRQEATYQLVVTMRFDGRGGDIFEDITGAHEGESLAILLDGVVQSYPNIREKIAGGSAQIEGDFTPEQANYLAKILRAGAFPVGVRLEEERTVGPTLGQESINNGIKAAIIGMALVIVFMIFYYRISGLIAVAALIFNMEIIIGAMAGLNATLTLPGLAGLVLTIGIAVDANVLIFERIREELKTGKTVRSAIDSGYQRAFWTIFDANVTTLLVAGVLYQFGTGPIKGFAITLGIGIAASMFTALVVTREIYSWIYRAKKIEKLSI